MIIFSGFTYYNEEKDKLWYYTDDKDSLPADIREFKEQEYATEDFSITAFLREAFKGEQQGFRYNIQIGELFYETPES